VYSETKYAVRALTDGLRQEVNPYDFRTTTISPGAVKTELLQHISDRDVQSVSADYAGRAGVSPDSYARIAALGWTSRNSQAAITRNRPVERRAGLAATCRDSGCAVCANRFRR
jgi:NADP-dependent 3-hydroxy acid dehydrogenase YdfG